MEELASSSDSTEEINQQENTVQLYFCVFCSKRFRKEGFWRRHMKIHAKNSASSASTSAFAQHALAPYSCQMCSARFFTTKDYQEHVDIVHTDLKVLRCTICGCFRPINELLQTNPIKCASCNILTATTSLPPSGTDRTDYSTSNTMTTLYSNGYSVIPVVDAGNTSIKPKSPRNRSDKKLPEEKNYPCPSCDKRFSHVSSLNVHKKVHTGDYKYICSYCNKTFFLHEYYAKHVRVHTKEKPYECAFCGKCFSQSNTLTQHKRIHTGEKPYRCLQCGKMFSVKDYLNKHMRVHTGEKPYKCQVCDKMYTQISGLRMHQKKQFHL